MIKSRGHLTTEKRNPRSKNIDALSTVEILKLINDEDRSVAFAVRKEIRNISRAVDILTCVFKSGGKLFYVGAGTSGRLGILDASECPPTFGVPLNMVKGIIAGGNKAIKRSIEGAEDKPEDGAREIKNNKISSKDMVIGIATGSTTPFVLGALNEARKRKAKTVFFSCNLVNKPPKKIADILITPVVGPEVITGSTRMKAGTATKLVLNMITTAVMIKLGKVYQNLMVDLQVKNKKLLDRSVRIIIELTGVSRKRAEDYLKKAKGSLKTAIVMIKADADYETALNILNKSNGIIKIALKNIKKGKS